MKKVFLSFVIIITICLVLTGCGSTKTLECTISNSSDKLTYIFEYSNNKINKAKLDYSMDTSNYYDPDGFNELLENTSLCDFIESSFKERFSDCKEDTSTEIKSIHATLDMDRYNTSAANGINSMKKELEESGLTCTIR